MPEHLFPEDFLWGAATSSYQIEGSPDADGKGESIWDRFSHTEGNIYHGDNGDVACDHYRRYEEDVRMMADIGLNAYRFSVSWPRIFPRGGGRANPKGLDFYRRLTEQLHARQIEPALTLYHWDLPQALQEKGGWKNRDTAKYFAEYATFLFENFDLPVGRWITLNEPWVSAFLGHAFGIHAPGENDFNTALQVSHNLLLSHGLAVKAFRESGRSGEPIGIALNLTPVYPASDSPADNEAAIRTDGFMNRWFLDPILRGGYPQDMVNLFSRQFSLPQAEAQDTAVISEPIDFLGVNYYTRIMVQAGGSDDDFMGNPVIQPESEYTEMDWEIYPRGLYRLLVRLRDDYGPLQLYVTENGAAFPDDLNNEGRIEDQRRIDYLRAHLLECRNALDEGVPLKGYYAWSLMDNFEWSHGYSRRFGLIFVDYPTLKRYFKDSAYWYKDVISRNGLQA